MKKRRDNKEPKWSIMGASEIKLTKKQWEWLEKKFGEKDEPFKKKGKKWKRLNKKEEAQLRKELDIIKERLKKLIKKEEDKKAIDDFFRI
ncbi:MAG: hypothetical protein ACE5J4_00965 [Candidatus Aenigmatarchaeota archaeon]